MEEKYKEINDAIIMNEYEKAKSKTNDLRADKNKKNILSQICTVKSYYSKISVINGLRQEDLLDKECHEKVSLAINKKILEEKAKFTNNLEKMSI